MTRSLSNLYKAGFVTVDESTRIIDMNEVLEQRLREEIQRRQHLPEQELTAGQEGFTEGLQAENVDDLLQADREEAIARNAAAQEQERLSQEIEAAKKELDDLQTEAQQRKVQLEAELETMRAQAYEEAKQNGYTDGYADGLAELQQKEQLLEQRTKELEQEHENQIRELEPQMVDALADIYSHIFKIDVGVYRELVCTLLEDTLLKTDSVGTMMIHVSREDLAYVQEQKAAMLETAGLQPGSVEIIADATLSRAQCMIETEGGVYDCSLDTELSELKRQLMLLAYRRE